MRKQVFSVTLPPQVIAAIKGAVGYFGFRSQSTFVEMAIAKYLEELSQSIEQKDEIK